ncbi:MAG: hypothetical protein AB7G28_16465 [Pirellulales bacterium]
MEIDLGRLYGVVTGDVVGSTKLNAIEREALYQVMRDGSQELQGWLGKKTMPLEVDIYGGDTWQILLADPGKSLAAGIFFRAFLRSRAPRRDTRFVAAVGPVDFVPRNKVSEGDGEAFRLSGQGLAELKKRRMGFFAHDLAAARQWDLAFELIDALAMHWREKRSLAVTGAVREWTQDQIRQLWSPAIEQSTVNMHLKAAGWGAAKRGVDEFQMYWDAYDGK